MSYFLDVIGALLIPREVFILQHRVLREYGKTAVGPDFVHTFPSFLVLAALVVVVRRKFNVKYLNITHKSLEKILQIFVKWIVISSGLWYWLIFQRILYCSIWSYWKHEIELQYSHVLWWQRVWQSLYPPPASPPPISASFVSWILSMIISGGIFYCSLHLQSLTKKFQKAIFLLIAHVKLEIKNMQRGRPREIHFSSHEDRELIPEAPDKSEISSFCDECHSNISAEGLEQNEMSQRPFAISSRGQSAFHTDSHKIMKTNSNYVADESTHHRRSLFTIISNNSNEKF